NSRRRLSWRLWRARRLAVGREANRAAERVPGTERWTVLLESSKHQEPEDEGHNAHHCYRPPGDAVPAVMEFERALLAHHYRCPPESDGLVAAPAGTECCFRKKNCPIG